MALLYSLNNEMNVDLPDLVTAKYFDALVEALEIQTDKRGTVETVRQALAGCGQTRVE